jgi:hypothetical protein
MPIRFKFIIPLFLFWVAWCLGGGMGLAACPGDPHFDRTSILHVTSVPVPTSYFHNLSTSQIEALSRVRLKMPTMREPGLTWMEHQLKTDYKYEGATRGSRASYCIWAVSLRLDFSFTRMDVYLSNQYPVGSCEYNVILGHENQHVAINTRTFEKYKRLMLQALRKTRTIPTPANPLSVRSMEEGRAIIGARVDHIVMPLYDRFKRELVRENAKIDTPQSYRRLQAQCKKWGYSYGR